MRGPTAHPRIGTLSKQAIAHIAFLVTILIKGFFGLLEVTAGLIIAITGPQKLYSLALQWTTPELYQGRQSPTAEFILQGAAALAESPGHFVIFYLLVHGALKMAITGTLLRHRGVWVFPFAAVILAGFIAYMCLELSDKWSNWLLGLSLLDTVTLLLVLNEWRTWNSKHPRAAAPA
jgi:uncharacterized membrane protein